MVSSLEEKDLDSISQVGAQSTLFSNLPLRFRSLDFSTRPVDPENPAAPVSVRILPIFRHWEVKPLEGKEALVLRFKVQIWWHDWRFDSIDSSDTWPPNAPLPKNIWRPEFFSLYVFDMLQVPDLEGILPTFVTPREPSGKLFWEVEFPDLPMNMLRHENALRNFPFDSTRLDFGFCLSGEKRLETERDIIMHFDNEFLDQNNSEKTIPFNIQFTGQVSVGEFALDRISFALGSHFSPAMKDVVYRDAFFSLHIRRIPSFYLNKGVLPLVAIASLGAMSYFMKPEELGNRLSLICTMFLTCFAVQWITVERLPRVPYNTAFDKVVFAVGACLFTMALAACITIAAKRQGLQEDLVELLDAVSFGIAYTSFILALIGVGVKIRKERKKDGMDRKFGQNFFKIKRAWEVTADAIRSHKSLGIMGKELASSEF